MAEPQHIEVLEALFVGDEVDAFDVAQLATAAQQDDELCSRFDTLALADREVGGDFEARFGEAWFLDSLDTMLAEEADVPAAVVVLADRRPRAQVWLAAAAVFAVGFGALVYDSLQTRAPEFQARSAATTKQKTYELPTLALFCVERDGDAVKFVGAEQSELATVRCGNANEIKLAVRNPDRRLRHAAFFGVSADDTIYWYGPSPVAPKSIEVVSGTELVPVGETIRLDVNHQPGTVRVVALFVEEPMEWSTVQQWVKEHQSSLRDGDAEVPRGVMIRQTFEVTP